MAKQRQRDAARLLCICVQADLFRFTRRGAVRLRLQLHSAPRSKWMALAASGQAVTPACARVNTLLACRHERTPGRQAPPAAGTAHRQMRSLNQTALFSVPPARVRGPHVATDP